MYRINHNEQKGEFPMGGARGSRRGGNGAQSSIYKLFLQKIQD